MRPPLHRQIQPVSQTLVRFRHAVKRHAKRIKGLRDCPFPQKSTQQRVNQLVVVTDNDASDLLGDTYHRTIESSLNRSTGHGELWCKSEGPMLEGDEAFASPQDSRQSLRQIGRRFKSFQNQLSKPSGRRQPSLVGENACNSGFARSTTRCRPAMTSSPRIKKNPDRTGDQLPDS